MKEKKILWIVKREVYAPTIEEALKMKGRIYEVGEAANQPDQTTEAGFAGKKKPCNLPHL